MLSYKYSISSSDNTITHCNSKFHLSVNILNEFHLTLDTDIQSINYYVNLICNPKAMRDYSIKPIINDKYTYDTNILELLFNYKSLDTIIKKLYEHTVSLIPENDIKYIFKYIPNTDKQYYTPITNFYVSNKKLFSLIIDMLENIISHPNANDYFYPRPEYVKCIKNLYIEYGNNKTNIEQVINNLRTIESLFFNLDEVLINDNKYKFSIETEIFELNQFEYHILLISTIEFNKYYLQEFKVNSVCDNITIYKVEYNDRKTSQKFDTLLDKEQYNIGWHGSNILNWYSILYNGLVAGSKKAGTVANGSAYGEGIYISDTLNYSITYSNNRCIGNNKQPSKNNIILGLFQIYGGLDKFKKASQIYVVPNSNLLCMRYLVVGSYANISKNIKKLDTYFIKSHTETKKEEKQVTKKKGNCRILKEIKMMSRYNDGPVDDNGLTLEFSIFEEQINIWRCKLSIDNFKDCNYLYSDLQKYNINNVEFEILLPERYPFEPPFIRLVSPRFAFLSGHITRGGSICMELLTKQGWTSSISVDKVLLMIKQNMMDGEARIDPKLIGKVYGYQEAVEAYDRMLRNHPEWTTLRK
jgi:ubiquitin-protein ligase